MKIAFLGDIAFVGQFDITKNPNLREQLSPMAEYLSGFDLVVANLESPFTEKKHSMVCKGIHVKTSPKNAELLKFLHVDVVSLANNHMFDYSRKGYEDTVLALENQGISYFGINGKIHREEMDGNCLKFMGYCCYTANGTRYRSETKTDYITPVLEEDIISKISEDHCLPVVSIHWGDENVNYPRYEHMRFARSLAERGTFLLHGHHPHALQGIEKKGESLIAYSLGNFCFDEIDSHSVKGLKNKMQKMNRQGCVLAVTVENNQITDYECKTFAFGDGEMNFVSNEEFPAYSEALLMDENVYVPMRQDALTESLKHISTGKKNLSWIFKRLNYYFIGAVLKGRRNQKNYRKTFRFLR